MFRWRSLILAVVFCAAISLTIPQAMAHGSYGLVVPRQDTTRPVPVVDGALSPGEYGNGWRYTQLLYRPRVAWSPAPLTVIATNTDLYLNLSNLPDRLGTLVPSVTVAFDINHNGGAVPDADDLLFTIDENGQTSVQRGNGTGGFVTATGVTGWTAVRGFQTDLSWCAEMRIPLSLLGGGAPGTLIGFHIRHNNLRNTGDDYAWGPTASNSIPNTWGDLLWGYPVSTTPTVSVDALRVTQGLDFDCSAGVPYDLIAGKETLIRTQVYERGAIARISSFLFRVQRVSPTRGSSILCASVALGSNLPNGYPSGYFSGGSTYQLWLDGSLVDTPGDYQIRAVVGLEGVTGGQDLDLGIWTFRPSADLRLLVLPWNDPYVAAPLSWGSSLLNNIQPVLRDVGRLYPVRRGVGRVFASGGPGARAGLRYMLMDIGDGSRDPDGTASDRHGRTLLNDTLNRYNAAMDSTWDQGHTMDRLDYSLLLAGTSRSGGGQAQFGWNPPTAGAGFDPDFYGIDASVIFQEVAHCMGEVSASSPNHIPDNVFHSRNGMIQRYHGLPAVNTLLREEYYYFYSDMHPTVTNSFCTFTEGYEWNHLRKTLLAIPHEPYPMSKLMASSGAAFYLVGQIDNQDNIKIDYTQRMTDPAFPLTPADLKSPYRLVFYSGLGQELGSLNFAVDFNGAIHDSDDQIPSVLGLILAAPLPVGTTSVAITKNGTMLTKRAFTTAAPTVSNVVAVDKGQGWIDLAWKTTDLDNLSSVTHNIFYQPSASGMPRLVASGLTGSAFSFPTRLLAPTTDGRLLVEASDGLNTGKGLSNAFTVAARPPTAVITSPQTTSTLVAGQPFSLSGCAYDLGAGTLSDQALTWNDGTKLIGTGEQAGAALASGPHVITLTAKAPSGLQTTTSVTVNVLIDSDGDGLPDVYETKYKTIMDPAKADADQDPDGDGLTNLEEWRRGTDPSNPDTDSDGYSDSDELKLGSDPLNPSSIPLPDQVYLADHHIDFGIWANKTMNRIIPVQTSSSKVAWKSVADQDWLTVSSGGLGNGSLSLTANGSGLAPGRHLAHVAVSADGSQLNVIEVELTVPDTSAIRNSLDTYDK